MIEPPKDQRGHPANEDILRALQESGYLMEQEVATQFENLGYFVRTNSAFEDPDEGKSREIDVSAHKGVWRDFEHKIAVEIEFIVECKKINSPLVFIKRKKNLGDNFAQAEEIVFPFNTYYENGSPRWAFRLFNFAESHYYWKEPLKAVQFSRIDRKGSSWHANHAGVYDAILMPLAKAYNVRRQQVRRNPTSDEWAYLRVLVPTVVIRGPLYDVDASNTHPALAPAKHVTFSREFKGKPFEGRFLSEFVSEASLADFVTNKVEDSVADYCRIIHSNPERFRTQVI